MEVSGAVPSGRLGAAAAVVPGTGRVLVFGGSGANMEPNAEMLALSVDSEVA